MTVVVDERSTEGLAWTFEWCSAGVDCDGVGVSDEPNDGVAGESDECE